MLLLLFLRFALRTVPLVVIGDKTEQCIQRSQDACERERSIEHDLLRNLTEIILLHCTNGKLSVSSERTPSSGTLTMSFASILHPTNCIRTFVSFAIVSASERKQGGEAFGSNFISAFTNYPSQRLILFK